MYTKYANFTKQNYFFTWSKCRKDDIFVLFSMQDKDPSTLLKHAMESLQALLKGILLQDPVPPTFDNILKVGGN